MYSCFSKLPPVVLLVACLMSCSLANNKPLSIRFSADSTAIVFSAIDPAGLLQIRNRPGVDTAYADLISVLETSGDEDSTGRERDIPGKLEVTDSTLVFKPLKSFVPGKNYLVVSFMNSVFANTGKVLGGQLNHRVEPQQVVLKR